MNILFLNAGNETGGGMHHILQMLDVFTKREGLSFRLGVFEKKQLYTQAEKMQIEVVHFKASHKWNPLLLEQLITYIEKHQISHVHTHGPRANVYMRYIKKRLDVAWLVTVHSDPCVDFIHQGLRGKFLTKLHLHALKKADYLIAVCNGHKQSLLGKGMGEDRITVIQNGLAFTNHIKAENVHNHQEERFVMVQVARLEKVKGHIYALKAMKKLLEQTDVTIQLYLVGDGTLAYILKQKVRELELEPYVFFVGETDDVDYYYKKADMVLLTSLSEGFPYVLLEAANYKRPVITTDVGDIGKLICSQNYGWMVPKEDVTALYEGMKEALQLHRANRLRERGEKLYHFAKNNFSLDKCAEEVYNIYQHIQA